MSGQGRLHPVDERGYLTALDVKAALLTGETSGSRRLRLILKDLLQRYVKNSGESKGQL